MLDPNKIALNICSFLCIYECVEILFRGCAFQIAKRMVKRRTRDKHGGAYIEYVTEKGDIEKRIFRSFGDVNMFIVETYFNGFDSKATVLARDYVQQNFTCEEVQHLDSLTGDMWTKK